jgi:hypothetical protein
MSTQSIRNIISNKISRIISDVKIKVKEEGEKKVEEIQKELMSPSTIAKIFQSEINSETCSIEGKNQFQNKVKKIETNLNEVENIALKGMSALQKLENEIIGLTSFNLDLPPGTPNPLGSIDGITELLSPLINTLNNVVKIAPAILGSQISFPGTGGNVSGLIISNTNNNVNIAKSKISEFKNLFRSLPKIIQTYQKMVDPIYKNIISLKEKIQPIIDQINISKAFLVYLEMDYLDKCNQLDHPYPPENLVQEEPPSLTLEDIIAQTEEIYGNILNELIAQGDTKAIERIYALNQNIINIKTQVGIRTINIYEDPLNDNNPTSTNPNTTTSQTYTSTGTSTTTSQRY